MFHYCYLCHNPVEVKRAINVQPIPTKLLRHPKCFKTLRSLANLAGLD